MGALSEYGALAGGQHRTFRPPPELGGVVRWVVYAILAYLALRLVTALLRGPSRR
jgi:hypothetical protein